MPMQTAPTYKLLRDRFNERLYQEVALSQSRIDQAARYILKGEGKRIRPMLLLGAALDLGVDEEKAIYPALALELLHNYSLIHDDLPCMDDDELRRGKPAVHVAFDEATAVLAGDYLLTESFGQILSANKLSSASKETCLKLLHYYAGGAELLLGQSLDLQQVPELGTFQDLKTIYQKKTASLFCCALKMAASLAQIEAKEEKALSHVGLMLGLAFQIQNDFLGRQKDSKKKKFTIFSLCNEEQAKTLRDRFIQNARYKLEEQKLSFDFLRHWIEEVFIDEI